MATKATKPKVAKKASAVLSNSSTGKASKSVAGSALAQVNPAKVTSKKVATAASKVMRDGRTSAVSKSVAGSALSQTSGTKRKGTITGDSGPVSKGTSSGGPRIIIKSKK